MRKLVLFVAVLFASFITFAADAPYAAWWTKANAQYSQKQYDSAAYYYEQIAALHPQDAVVYYNLGNTYYRLNRIGPAVYNYERALFLKPGYKEAADNLSLTQARIRNRIQGTEDIFFVRWWKAITLSSYANTWAILSLLVFLLWIAALIANKLGKFRALQVQAHSAIGLVLAILLVFSYTSAMRRSYSNKGVVMTQDAELMATPQQGKSQALIPEGTTLRVEGVRNNWVEVQLPDGRMGWLQKEQVANI